MPGPARPFNEMRMTSCLFLLRKRLQPTEFSHNIAGTAAPYHINIDDATVKRLRVWGWTGNKRLTLTVTRANVINVKTADNSFQE